MEIVEIHDPHEDNDARQPCEQNPEGELLPRLDAQELLQAAPLPGRERIDDVSGMGHALIARACQTSY
jgi:hypothetical protein